MLDGTGGFLQLNSSPYRFIPILNLATVFLCQLNHGSPKQACGWYR
jgi:hypothetical protein